MTTPPTDDVTARLRAALLDTTDHHHVAAPPAFPWQSPGTLPRPRRWTAARTVRATAPVAVALAVAAAVAAAVALPDAPTGAPATPVPSATAPAASSSPGDTGPVRADQYYYSRWVEAQTQASSGPDSPDPNPYPDAPGTGILDNRQVVEVWQPADPSRDWVQRITTFGPDGAQLVDPVVASARCGALPGSQNHPYGLGHPYESDAASACDDQGSWFNPTAEFLAAQPTDPAELAQVLDAFVVGDLRRAWNPPEDPDMAVDEARVPFTTGLFINRLLATSNVSHTLSQALQGVLAGLPGVEVDRDATNLAGVPGTSYSVWVDRGDVQEETSSGDMVFDAGGAYIGSAWSALETGVADTADVPPAGLVPVPPLPATNDITD